MLKLKKTIAFLLTLAMVVTSMPVSLMETGTDQVTDTIQNKDVVLTPREEEPEKEPENKPEEAPEKTELIRLSSEDISVSPLSDQRLEELKGQIAGKPVKGPSMLKSASPRRGAAPQPVTNSYTGFAAFEISPKDASEAEQYDVDVQLGSPITLLEEENAEIENVTFELYHFHTDEKDNLQVETITAENGLDVVWKNNQITGFSFSTADFDEFVLKYTVVFHYNDKEFTCELPGAKDIALAEILTSLEIVSAEDAEAFLADVANVEVSDSETIRLANDPEGWKIRILKESAEPVSLTVTLLNGQKHIITVSATGNTELAAEDGSAVIRTVNDYYLPEDAAVYAEALSGEKNDAAVAAVQSLEDDKKDGENEEEEKIGYQAYSIGLDNVVTEEYEGFSVDVSLDSELGGKDFRLYQVQDGQAMDITDTLQLNGDTREDGSQDVRGFSFTTSEFADYVLCYTLVTYYTAFDGTTYQITLAYGKEADIPDGAELKVREIAKGDEFNQYLASSAEKIGINSDDVAFARFFDIEIQHEGQKIEPKAPVEVVISYVDEMPLDERTTLCVVHFGETGTEVITDISVSEENKKITYQQSNFSVTGTIISSASAQPNGSYYAVIIRNDSTNPATYYAVKNDGSLVEVDYREENGTACVDLDTPLLWNYISAHDGLDEATNSRLPENWNMSQDHNDADYHPYWEPYNLRIPYEARGYNWAQLAEGTYYRYISPFKDNGIDEESETNANHNASKYYNALRYAGNKISGVSWTGSQYVPVSYIGADFETMHITGNKDQNDAATVLLARIDTVPNRSSNNETVSHIDIAIKGDGVLDVPLANGKYYDVNGQLLFEVTSNNPVKLHLKKEVDITKEDIMRGELNAYHNNGEEIDNAFYITGYTSNQQNEHSAVQVRMEGSFKVTTLSPYQPAGWWDRSNDNEGRRNDRLKKENQVFYRFSTTKDVTFDFIDDEQEIPQLYDAQGNKLTATAKISMSAGFSYWDPGNECPPVLADFEQKYGMGGTQNEGSNHYWWEHGAIIDNDWSTQPGHPSYKGDSGMDFVLGNKEDSENKTLAIEIVKIIEDESGNRIHPDTSIRNDFKVYYNAAGDPGSVRELAVSPNSISSETINYNGYIWQRDHEIVIGDDGIGVLYDYDVSKGMYYVMEEDTPMKNEGDNVWITDKDGKKWKYKTTRTQTEYVWRDNNHDGKLHNADGYSSVPEILGNYVDDNGISQYNGFLEFYVHNIYELETNDLTISKTIISPVPADSTQKEFTFTVKLTKPNGTPLTGKYVGKIFNENNQQVGADKEYIFDTEGKTTVTTTGNQKVTIYDLPQGVNYEVTESSDSDFAQDPVNTSGTTGTIDEDGAEAVFTNKRKTGNLTIDKSLQGADGDAAPTGTYSYPIRVTTNFANTTYYVTTSGNGYVLTDEVTTLTVTNGTTLTLTNLPVSHNGQSLTYKVEEVNPGSIEVTGYTNVKVNGITKETVNTSVSQTTPGQASLVNVYKLTKLTIRKAMDVGTSTETFTFTVTAKKGNTVFVGKAWLDNKKKNEISFAEGKYTASVQAGGSITIYGLPDGYEYTVSENDKSGFLLVSVDGSENKVQSTGVISGTESTAAFVNKEVVTIEVDKKWVNGNNNNDWPEGVTVGIQLTADDEPVAGKTASLTAGDPTYTFTDLPKYKVDGQDDNGQDKIVEIAYSVQETDINGYESKVGTLANGKITITNTKFEPHKKETAPYEGTGVLGAVKVGDVITYEISYKNYKAVAADVAIKDTLDANVEFVSADNSGAYDEEKHIVTWTLTAVPAGKEGTVTLTVKVLEGALESNGGEGEVVNGGPGATVKVGNDQEYTLNEVENPVPEEPEKQETSVTREGEALSGNYSGNGTLGNVQVGDRITYEISYTNYKATAADVKIKDTLDENVAFVSASNGGTLADGIVSWTLTNVAAGASGKVTLTVEVKESALKSKDGPGNVVNGGPGATVQVGNDSEFTLETVENPVEEEPHKQETGATHNGTALTGNYTGNGTLGTVQVGDEITYEISYTNYKAIAADVKIKDTLDKNVALVSASDSGKLADGIVTWTLANVAAGASGTVTLTVKVLEGALKSNDGEGKVVNGGETATVQVGNDNEFTLETVENPVPEEPAKKETAPYEGNGLLGAVKVGDEITYEISYRNYKTETADVVIKDTLDANVEFVSAGNSGAYDEKSHIVTWTLTGVEAGKEDKVTLTVKVLEGALESNSGEGKVVNGGPGATVKVGNDAEYTLDTVENPVPEEPHKQETAPYEGNGVLGMVQVGDEITYEISYRNYKTEAATVTIKDKLDKNAEFIEADSEGVYDGNEHQVTWTLADVAAGAEGKVTLKIRVLEGALVSNGGAGKVVNGGETATVQVGNDNEFTLETVENPVPEEPHKQETAPYEGNGVLGGVKVGDEITYEISYRNYKAEAADVVIRDKLDVNAEFVEADSNGSYDRDTHTVTWTAANTAAGAEGKVTLKIRVLEGALVFNGGEGKVVNGGETATVKVGNDDEFTLETVENPVPEEPHKQETAPYEGNGVLGAVKVGDIITYEISYRNYKSEAATVTIKDKLDPNVAFAEADNSGSYDQAAHLVTWTLENVAAGAEGKVALKVKVLEGALVSAGGPGKVINDGDTATVKVGNDNEFTLDTVENPVTEEPHKRETAPYTGNGTLGVVQVGDELTYEISFTNYKAEAATVTVKDTLDRNVAFVSADNGGIFSNGTVTWTLENVAAGAEGKVTLTVQVLEGALKAGGGPGKVANGGDTATVKVGNDNEFTLETVENPVDQRPHKTETVPYAGSGDLGKVEIGDDITYRISFTNYKAEAADVIIRDKLDPNVTLIHASNGGAYDAETHTVTWTLAAVPAGASGHVNLIVRVRQGALVAHGGPGKVTNGGETTTVKIGNDQEIALETVTNPVDTVTLTVRKVWDDANDAAKLRPAVLKVKLSNGNNYYLRAENNWTVTVPDLPKYENGELIPYTWSEQSVVGYTSSVSIQGETTIFTNHCVVQNNPKRPQNKLYEFEDMPTPLGIGICLNHVGDNFE